MAYVVDFETVIAVAAAVGDVAVGDVVVGNVAVGYLADLVALGDFVAVGFEDADVAAADDGVVGHLVGFAVAMGDSVEYVVENIVECVEVVDVLRVGVADVVDVVVDDVRGAIVAAVVGPFAELAVVVHAPSRFLF